MAILVDENSKVVVQGITGKEGSFHARNCMEYGTNIVAGVTPGKGGTMFDDKVPVFDSVAEAVDATGADVSLLFVPPPFAKDAILEAADAGIRLAVVITEGIPVWDMMEVFTRVPKEKMRIIGPNCPGIISPERCKVGIMPAYIHKRGPVGVLSRSGTLTYEAVAQLTELGIGQSTCIGLGGDPLVGTSFIDGLKLFEEDEETKAVLLIGEIGGTAEEEAAEFIKEHVSKPVVAFVAGVTAPAGKRMGHAGAIITGGKGDARSKIEALAAAGVHIVTSPDEIGATVAKALQEV